MREDADSPAKTQQLNAQTQRLASLGFMVASVCHEVSNPLAAVSSMLQILRSKRGVTPETLEKGLASISGNVARVLAITKKLGDYSRVGGEPPARE
jgi:signal transduction histidine kinase